MSWAMSQRPFSFTQRTRYLPESTAGAPGGRLAAAGHSKRQRPCSTAMDPLPQTESACRVRAGDTVFNVPKDRKSTRLNSSHSQISYAVFCLKKKNKNLQGQLRAGKIDQGIVQM